MSKHICISVTFLDRRFHGQSDNGEPEWPPSPLRLFQAIVAANSKAINREENICNALRWLECQESPTIFAPRFEFAVPFYLSVPNNSMDIVGKAWSKRNYFGKGDANPATHRTMKAVRPVRMFENATVHYLWPLPNNGTALGELLEALKVASGRIFALGWGIDMVTAHCSILTLQQLDKLKGERWLPSDAYTHNPLRKPIEGTLKALCARYKSFLKRIDQSGFTPVEPLSHFEIIGYRRMGDALGRPYIVFELRQNNGKFYAYPQRKLVHIAGMLRHIAINHMRESPPTHISNPVKWLDTYVAGHAKSDTVCHHQFSYIPLPSIGMRHTDPSVRRVMIAAPLGDNQLLEHLASRIAGQQLQTKHGNEFGHQPPPTLVRVRKDHVTRCYTNHANLWASVTPVILPGHDDRKKNKTAKLVAMALRQSGIEQPCTYEWRATSWWPQSLSAYKYDRNGQPIGYIRPHHLLTQTAIHLKIHFNNDIKMPGPLIIGAGRHCGFGLMAGFDKGV